MAPSITSLVLLGLAVTASALPYSKSSGVLELTKKNFAEQIFGTEHVSIVEFYAPCGHCKKLEPDMIQLAEKNKGIFKVAAINCDEEKELCGNFDIKGFPTLKIFPSEAVPVPKNKGKGFHKVPEDYNGPRSAGDMARVVLNKVPSFVQNVDDSNVDKFLAEPGAKVLLFTDKPKTTALYKAISIEFHNRIAVAEVKKSAKAVVDKYEITKFPTLLVVTESGEKVVYDDKLKYEKIAAFVKPHAKPSTKSESGAAPEKPKEPEFVHPAGEEVKDQESFEKICHSSGKFCLIALLDPQDTDAATHASYIKILEKVAEKSKDLLHVVWIDGPKNFEFGEKLGLSFGYPAVITYAHKKAAKIPYIGAFSEEDLVDYVKGIRSNRRKASSAPTFPKLKYSNPPKETKKDEL